MGVAGIDVTVCDLEEQLYQANPKIQVGHQQTLNLSYSTRSTY